jgi:hypothetical protein
LLLTKSVKKTTYASVALLALCFLTSWAKEKEKEPQLPPEIFAAKSIAVVVNVIGAPETNTAARYKAKVEAGFASEIEKHHRFQLVSDPSRADLVCLVVQYWRYTIHRGRSFFNLSNTLLLDLPPDAVIILAGGANPHPSTLPLWVGHRAGHMHGAVAISSFMEGSSNELIKEFFGLMKKAEKPEPATADPEKHASDERPAGSATPEPEAPTAQGPAVGETTSSEHESAIPQPDAPQKGITVFCQMDFKDCNPSPEIYGAKILSVCTYDSKGNQECPSTWPIAHLKPGGLWTLAPDPQKSDLIVIFVNNRGSVPAGYGRWEVQYNAMYVLRGDPHRDWRSMVLFASLGYLRPADMLQGLHRFVAEKTISPAQSQGTKP